MKNLFLSFKKFTLFVVLSLAIIGFNSCKITTFVKHYPVEEPFVYKTNIQLIDKQITKEEKAGLEAGLFEQLDDSIQSRSVDKVLWATIKNPPRLDSSAISKSLQYMHYYLNSHGYYNDSISFSTTINRIENQQRAHIDFKVWPGPLTRIDSLSYTLHYDSLQQLAARYAPQAVIRKGSPFALTPISSELDRLVELYRNHGYIKFSRDLLFALWDTIDVSLLQPALDPFEQVAQLQRLQERKLRPLADLDLRLRPIDDTTRVSKYYVGDIFVFPDVNADTLFRRRKTVVQDGLSVIQYFNKFKPKIFAPNIYFKKGELFDQRKQVKTLNRLNNLGSWRLVDVQYDTTKRWNQDTIDFKIFLTPARKFNFTTNLEGSYSQSALSGNFLGTGINFGLQNRNFLRGANLASSNLRYGVELNLGEGSLIQTQQISLNNSLAYPRFIIPGLHRFKQSFPGTVRSIFSLNGANTERRFLFNLTSFNTSWGYELSWVAKTNGIINRSYNLGIKLPNIEYSRILKRDSLLRMIERNPAINNIFSDGLITSTIVNFTMPWSRSNSKTTQVFRSNLESSGLLTGLIRNEFIDRELYRFVKVDAEYARLLKWTKTSLVVRAFAGIGYELEATQNPNKRDQLPFYKQFYSGGPNSMRAWQLRRLGPGSNVNYFTGEVGIPDRFGDVQLEANIEYRMPLMNVAGIPINGALFTDMGNVWLLKKTAGAQDEVFRFSRLGTDLAIGAGAGVRIDFGFFVIRFDYAYKVKDPTPSPDNESYQNRFFAYPLIKGSQLQLGIGYPFIF